MRIGDYPLPSYAAYIWHSGDSIRVLLPPTTSDDRSHTISLPIDRCGVVCNDWGQPLPNQRGWQALLQTLRARSSQRESARVGTEAAPTQYDLDAVMRAIGDGKLTKIEKKKSAPERLELENLDL
jgi:hypothetical protein